ncbi:hypothetical protein AB0N62_39015 [Streptomyces sp. NPDC093982]|uniref:hypothetical protein n=1 Tax=Streptomyces sp. NPDC093982 TaxID=3155077 RepID=UPI00341D3AFB
MLDTPRAAVPFQGPSAEVEVESRCSARLDMGVPKNDDYARTSARLTVWGCVAGLAVVLAIPVYMLVTFFLFGMPTP